LYFYAALIGPVRWHEGRLREHIDRTAAAAADNPGIPVVRAALARTYADAGRLDDAGPHCPCDMSY
jgi:hypothetical protein